MPETKARTKRPGRHPELDRVITVAGKETTVFDAAIERMRTAIPIVQAAASLGVRKQSIHEWRRRGVRLRERQIAGETINHPDELRLIDFADQCDTAEAEAYAIDWTRHGQIAAGGLEQRRTTTTVKTDADGKVESRTTVEQVERTLPHEGALRWRLGVIHGLHARVEVSGPDGGPIPVEAVAAQVSSRFAAFVEASATEVEVPDPAPGGNGLVELGEGSSDTPQGPLPSWRSGLAERMMDMPSPDADVPPPLDD